MNEMQKNKIILLCDVGGTFDQPGVQDALVKAKKNTKDISIHFISNLSVIDPMTQEMAYGENKGVFEPQGYLLGGHVAINDGTRLADQPTNFPVGDDKFKTYADTYKTIAAQLGVSTYQMLLLDDLDVNGKAAMEAGSWVMHPNDINELPYMVESLRSRLTDMNSIRL